MGLPAGHSTPGCHVRKKRTRSPVRVQVTTGKLENIKTNIARVHLTVTKTEIARSQHLRLGTNVSNNERPKGSKSRRAQESLQLYYSRV
jgi:hypothetical protein